MRPPAFVHAIAAGLLLSVAGCASVDPPPATPAPDTAPAPPQVQAPAEPPRVVEGIAYACDDGRTVHVRVEQDTVAIAGLARGDEVLLRDAGGITPEQTVWSNERLRAEFGLPPGGDGAELQLLQPAPATLHCRRERAAQ